MPMTFFTRRSLLSGLAAIFGSHPLRGGILLDSLIAQNQPALSESPRFWFTNVASRSNFPYRTNNDFTGRKYFPQPMCGGVAAIDYDNDGRMDLFFTNGSTLPGLTKTSLAFDNCLLRNREDGTFEDVTGKAGLA